MAQCPLSLGRPGGCCRRCRRARGPLMGTCDRSLVRKVDDGERVLGGLPTRLVSSDGRDGVAAPENVDVWVGLDVGKDEHFADVLDDTGEGLFACSVSNDEADL